MQILTETYSAFREELRGQLQDLLQTWTNDQRSRTWIKLAFGAAFFVIVVSLTVDLTRYFGLHAYTARFLSLTVDRSLPELVMDALALWAAVLAYGLFQRTGMRAFLLCAFVLAVMVVDDFLSLHEQLGALLVASLHIVDEAGLEAQALGEMLAFAVMGLCVLPVLVWCIWLSRPADLAVLTIFGMVFALFLIFAVGIDALRSMVENLVIRRLMGWFEDGGELLVMALFTAVVILQARGKRFA